MVKNYLDAEILKTLTSGRIEGFRGYPRGPMLIAVRSEEDRYNKFDDKLYWFNCFGENIPGQKPVKQPEFIGVATGTTHAGALGLKRFQTYGQIGCAVLKADVFIYESHIYGTHKGLRAYRQNKIWPYYRDSDRDEFAEEIGKEYRDKIIGANIHRMAHRGAKAVWIGGWSTACIGMNEDAEFEAWLAFMAGRPCNTAIIKEQTIDEVNGR